MPELRQELAFAGAAPEEAAQLAALLVRAAEPARFEVTRADVEAALERARPARRTFPRLAVAAAAIAAVALAVLFVVPGRQESVQARALAAFGGDDTVLHLREEVFARVAGVTGVTTRDVWLDPSAGRASWTETGPEGFVIADTLVVPGRFDRFLPNANAHLVGTSCNSVVAGCAQLLDPVSRYRELLRRSDARATRTTFDGRATYRFELPLQPGLDQLVYVDAETYLPRTIIWREDGHVVSTIDVTDVERLAREDVPAGTFARPMRGRVVNVAPAGRFLSKRRLSVEAARAQHPYWLGPRDLTSIVERRYSRGRAIVVRYGSLEVWTYRAVPPELLAPRLTQVKPVDVGGRPATYFGLGGRSAVARDGDPSVVVVGFISKEDIFAELGRVRRLR